MFSIIKLELKKFFKDKKNIVPVLIVLIFISIFVSRNMDYEKERSQSVEPIMERRIEDIESTLKEISKKDPNNKKAIEYLNKQLKLEEYVTRHALQRRTSQYLKALIDLDTFNIEMINAGYKYKYMDDINVCKAKIEQNTILLNQGIKPIDENCSMQGFNFLRLSFNFPVILCLLALVLFISADAYSSEIQYNTYKLLYTQAIKERKILFGKLMSKIILSFIVIISILLGCTLLLGFKNGFGTLKYPTQIILGSSIEVISLGNYLFRQFILLTCTILFICVLGVCISMFTKTISSTLSTSIIISGVAYLLCNMNFLNNFKTFLPFSYFNTFKTLTASNIVEGFCTHEEIILNMNLGVISLLISFTIILIFCIYTIEGRKNN